METTAYETRSRSRSKTPGLITVEKTTTKKDPPLIVIDEEIIIIEDSKIVDSSPPSSQEQNTRPKRTRKPPAKTADVIPDSSKSSTKTNVVVESKTKSSESAAVVSSTTTTVVSSSKKVTKLTEGTVQESSSSSSKTTQIEDSIQQTKSKENQSSIFGSVFNAIKTSTPIQAIKRSKRIIEKIDPKEHPAYKMYVESGEYWNNTPKTDYTYSELSPDRRVISDGFVAMPNMSRKSLDKFQYRVENMIQKNPTQESYLRKRYLTNLTANRTSADLQYDSQDEVDLSEFTKQKTVVQKHSILAKFFLFIINTFYYCKNKVRSIFYVRRDVYATPAARTVQKQGFFAKIYEFFKSLFLTIVSKFYVLISTILFLDTWLLQSSNGGNKKKKGFLLFLLVLFPFLLLGAFLLSEESEASKVIANLPLILKSQISNWIYSPFIGLFMSIKSLKNSFAFSGSSSRYQQLNEKLSPNELESLYKYIDNYIDSVIDKKIEINNENIESKFSLKMAQIINEQLNKYKYQITDHDIDFISENIKKQLEKDFLNILKLSQHEQNLFINNILLKNPDFLSEIEKIVQTNAAAHQNNQQVFFDEILAKILASQKLHSLIEIQSKSFSTDNEKQIENLKLQINQLKMELAQSRNLETFDNSKFLDLNDKFKIVSDELYKLKLETDERQNELSGSIDLKLASFGDTQSAKIDGILKGNLFTKEYLEARLKEVLEDSNSHLKLELEKHAGILLKEINERILLAMKNHQQNSGSGGVGVLNEAEIRRIVKEILAVYDADKTGTVDYALESAGGQILSTRCTENYQHKSAQISVFGIPLWYYSNTPRIAISPNVQPGECWAFSGFPGFLVIQLNNYVFVNGFTLEHIPKALSPNGEVDSAPNKFSVWGLKAEIDDTPTLFGNYQYLDGDTDPSLQFFAVQNQSIADPYQVVELRIESNHGNPQYTCLYRFRVHGRMKR